MHKRELEHKIKLAKQMASFAENAATVLFVFLVLFPLMLYQIGAFKKKFEGVLFILLEFAAFSICLAMLCISLVDLLYIKNKEKELEALKNVEAKESKNAKKIKLKNVPPYLIFVASFLFVFGEMLAIISLFSDFSFSVIPKNSKISFHSMIDITALCILLIANAISLFTLVQENKKKDDTENFKQNQSLVEDKFLKINDKKNMLKIAVAAFAICSSAISLSGRAIFALESTGNFSLLGSGNAFVPLGIPLRIVAMLLPFLVSAISASLFIMFSEEEEKLISTKKEDYVCADFASISDSTNKQLLPQG